MKNVNLKKQKKTKTKNVLLIYLFNIIYLFEKTILFSRFLSFAYSRLKEYFTILLAFLRFLCLTIGASSIQQRQRVAQTQNFCSKNRRFSTQTKLYFLEHTIDKYSKKKTNNSTIGKAKKLYAIRMQ